MKWTLYQNDHESFRSVVREYATREVEPHTLLWDEQRLIDRQAWVAAGRQGILGLNAPESFGGAGVDYRFRMVVHEELARVFATSLAASFSLQDDIVLPYIAQLGNNEQRQRWLPEMIAGESIVAVAMTEPGAGSDLQGITTSARKAEGGWLVNGSKTFVTSGMQADRVITVCRTDPAGGREGFSLLVVDTRAQGFSRGRKLAKIGLHAQDTAELAYDDVFVPDEDVLGAVGGGTAQLHRMLPLERLSIAAWAVAITDAVVQQTIRYTRDRSAFGRRLVDFQNTQFELADLTTEVLVARTFVDRCVEALREGELDAVEAARAKLYATEMQGRVIDRCLQLHGGYGYMTEYPVARAFQDARVQRIFGGTSEIMKHIIGRSLAAAR